jgi:uncharacterized coiled-coil protein SlyX
MSTATRQDAQERELARLRDTVARQADEIEVWRASDAELRGEVDRLHDAMNELLMNIQNLKLDLEEAHCGRH